MLNILSPENIKRMSLVEFFQSILKDPDIEWDW